MHTKAAATHIIEVMKKWMIIAQVQHEILKSTRRQLYSSEAQVHLESIWTKQRGATDQAAPLPHVLTESSRISILRTQLYGQS